MPEQPDGASGTPAATAGRREDPSQGTKPTAMVAGNPRVGGALSAEPAEVEPRKISSGGEIIRTHPIRHDRSRENGAFANPGGRPHRTSAA